MNKTFNETFDKRYFVLPRRDIGYLRFLLEGYDGLAFARTLEKQGGLVEIAFSPRVAATVATLLAALAEEIPLREVRKPSHIPRL